ncbi:DNA polymerase III subunit delta' [Ligilactobacillus sp. Marseille-Q7487]|jgi:DNA polymerase-3 subunit delta'|uniref:DNA polymerase III subunit delta' n=1 Tax=Ligilactobacillus sp. Marseille-Q7487 TaxID=3022128 RepID=UPI0015B5FBCD|nr:DNA polymerase III subunit delta' [Ligilactobacillus sp. Marseille-Q7487]
MSETIMQLQPNLSQHFLKLAQKKQLAHAYLLVGDTGLGKKALARYSAQTVFCLNQTEVGPCQKCSECLRIAQGIHPDVVEVDPQATSIKVEQIRHLKSEFSKSGLESARKFFIISEAEKMSTSAANSLLKFLEEPSGQVTAFLLTSNANLILPTIISRCQLFELETLSQTKRKQQLLARNISAKQVDLLVQLTTSLTQAQVLAEDSDFWELSALIFEWYARILQNEPSSFVMIQTQILPLIEQGDPKKQRTLALQLILLLARDSLLIHYQALTQNLAFSAKSQELQTKGANLTVEQLTKGIELILETTKKMTFNVSFQGLLEALTLKLLTCYHIK